MLRSTHPLELIMPDPSSVEVLARIIAFVVVFGIVAIFLALSVPLTGTLVRYRASYNPKGLALDAEGGAIPHTGLAFNSYFGMMSRVYRIEVLALLGSSK